MATPPRIAAAPAARPNPQPANAALSMSAGGITALRASEGQVNGGSYYNDVAQNCTGGAGILVHRGPCTALELQRPTDQQNNAAELARRIHSAEMHVRQQVPDRLLTQAQFDSMVSATFNLGGVGAAAILERANQNDNPGVVRELRANVNIQRRGTNGNRIGPLVRNQGLVNRREREALPFNTPQPSR